MAARLYSYAGNGKHHKGGGLLLRRDLHHLFDLGPIATNPQTKTQRLHDDLKPYPDCAKAHDAPLTVIVTADHIKRLTQHWTMHRPGTERRTIPYQSSA